MKPAHVKALWFSPTGGTKEATVRVAAEIARQMGIPLTCYDITCSEVREREYIFDSADLVVVGWPVYAARVLPRLLQRLHTGLKGNGALAVPVVTFGNRSYDIGLQELRNSLEEYGFHTVAGAALVTRHAFSGILSAGRPDAKDWAQTDAFAGNVVKKLELLTRLPKPVAVKGEEPNWPYYIPIGVDKVTTTFQKAKPMTEDYLCTGCRRCVYACPVGVISSRDPANIMGMCIKCHACIKVCPAGAKYFSDPNLISYITMMETAHIWRAEPEFFL